MFWCGELTAIETICHLIVTSELEECFITIPSPFDEDSSIDLYIDLYRIYIISHQHNRSIFFDK